MFIYIYMGDKLDNIGNRVVIGTNHFFYQGMTNGNIYTCRGKNVEYNNY